MTRCLSPNPQTAHFFDRKKTDWQFDWALGHWTARKVEVSLRLAELADPDHLQ
jgi:hypothetical protein